MWRCISQSGRLVLPRVILQAAPPPTTLPCLHHLLPILRPFESPVPCSASLPPHSIVFLSFSPPQNSGSQFVCFKTPFMLLNIIEDFQKKKTPLVMWIVLRYPLISTIFEIKTNFQNTKITSTTFCKRLDTM